MKGSQVVLNAENNWNYTWKDLDEYRQGEKIQYTVEEISQTGAYSVDITNEFSEGTRTGISTITNTHAPETTTIKAVKEVEEYKNNRRMASSGRRRKRTVDGRRHSSGRTGYPGWIQ